MSSASAIGREKVESDGEGLPLTMHFASIEEKVKDEDKNKDKDEEKKKTAEQQSVETHKTNELNTSLKQDVATLMVMGTGELIDQNVVQSKTSSPHNQLASNTVNDAPELTGTPATLAKGKEDTSYILKEVDLLQGFSDIDGDQLQVTGLRPAQGVGGSFQSNNDGTWTYVPDANVNGTIRFEYTVSDGNGGELQANNSIELEAVNDAPELTGTPATLAKGKEDTSYILKEVDLLQGFSDIDGDQLQVTGLRPAQGVGGSFQSNNDGTWTYVPDANVNGTIRFEYTVSDGNGGELQANNSIELEAVNDAPELTGTPATLAKGKEDTSYILKEVDLLQGFSDIDGDQLQVTGLRPAQGVGGSFQSNNDGTWTYVPDANVNGTIRFEYTVSDGNGGELQANNSIELEAVNDAPESKPIRINVDTDKLDTANVSLAQLLSGSLDIDGDKMSVSNVRGSDGKAIEQNIDGSWQIKTGGESGPYELEFDVTDGQLTTKAKATVNVRYKTYFEFLTTTIQADEGDSVSLEIRRTGDIRTRQSIKLAIEGTEL